MNRLTEVLKSKCGHNQIYYKDNTHNELRTPNEMSQDDMYSILNRLREYEDTGLTPKEVNIQSEYMDKYVKELNRLRKLEKKYEELINR